MTGWGEIRAKATVFVKRWKEHIKKGIINIEKRESQTFWNELFSLFGIDRLKVAVFEFSTNNFKGNTSFVDLFWPGKLLVEQKSVGINLDTAFEQATGYTFNMPDEKRPKFIIVSNFENFRIYSLEDKRKFDFALSDLPAHVRKFSFLLESNDEYEGIEEEKNAVNRKTAQKMADLHAALEESNYTGHDLELCLVRLVFCLFADNTDIFENEIFENRILATESDGRETGGAIQGIFEALNTKKINRQIPDPFERFPYVNGGLFSERIKEVRFNKTMRNILKECSKEDWSAISPAIFGSMFQGAMDEKLRRNVGAHYTSETNILKTINPLFMDDLKEEFRNTKFSAKGLIALWDKISKIKILDPACGCGNFLIIAYRELRLLELEIMNALDELKQLKEFKSKVNVNQFYGIELLEFPAQIAKMAMWLMDHKMNQMVYNAFGDKDSIRIPLEESANILYGPVEGNALRIDWNRLVSSDELSYILGNPPFIGASHMSAKQKDEAVAIFGKIRLSNSIDYVGAWYHKAAKYIQGTDIKVAFVSTNSITQGEQVAPLWDKLFNEYNVHIDFAWRTFKWEGQAAVHCVIIGFSAHQHNNPKFIYDGDGSKIIARNINAYLIDAPNILIVSRSKPICDVPAMTKGNQPSDGGHLILSLNERAEIISQGFEEKYALRYIGSKDYINEGDEEERYCLWLRDVPYTTLNNLPKIVQERIDKVAEFRLRSSAKPTVGMAKKSHLFFSATHPDSDYLAIPRVSSMNRTYIPIGYMDKNTISSDSNSIVPNATHYHFGILTSKVHMAWMRAFCGRLKSDYRYSGSIVYNNFPWPNVSKEQKAEIEKLARNVLDARKIYPESSFAKMYGKNTMKYHPELVKAHENLDRAVMKLYGLPREASEADIVADLLRRYQELLKNEK